MLNILSQLASPRCDLKIIVLFFSFLTVTVLLSSSSSGENSATGLPDYQVTIFDQGLKMPVATYILSAGWKLEHDIATNPYTGQNERYKLDILGPQGEIIRNLFPVFYGTYLGKFEEVWRQAAQHALQDIIQNAILGERLDDGTLVKKLKSSQHIKQDMKKAGVKELFEVDFTGTKNGIPYEGKLVVAEIPDSKQAGMIVLGILMSTAGMITQTIDTDIKIIEAIKPNIEYGQTLQLITECQRIWQASRYPKPFIKKGNKLVRESDLWGTNPGLFMRCSELLKKYETAKAGGNTTKTDKSSEQRVSPEYQADDYDVELDYGDISNLP